MTLLRIPRQRSTLAFGDLPSCGGLVLRREVRGVVGRDVRVEVRSRFDGSWCRGFEIVGVLDDGESYRIRRVTDGVVLPVSIDAEDIAEERTRLRYDRL